MNASPPTIGVIACRVFEDEIQTHASALPHIACLRYLEIGLHDSPPNLRENVQNEIDRMDDEPGIDAVVLLYALCGCGTAGLRAGKVPLVIPRAHDCITLFFGNKEKFARYQAENPGAYFYTPGWMRADRVPGPGKLNAMREELADRFDPDDIDFLIETEKEAWAQHGKATFLDLQTPGAEEKALEAKESAKWLGWQFERLPGDPTLFQKLLAGDWPDDEFQIIPPGETLQFSANEAIFKASSQSPSTPPDASPSDA